MRYKKALKTHVFRAFGGGEEIRTLAPAKPTYRISNPDPSTAWVHLHAVQQSGFYYDILSSGLQDFTEKLFVKFTSAHSGDRADRINIVGVQKLLRRSESKLRIRQKTEV